MAAAAPSAPAAHSANPEVPSTASDPSALPISQRPAAESMSEPFDAECQAALADLGLVYLRQGQPEDAAFLFNVVLASQPTSAAVYSKLGDAWRRQGRLPQAEHLYRQALALQPDSLEALCALAAVVLELGRLEEAVNLYVAAIEMAPQAAAPCSDLGNALRMCGLLDDAMAMYRWALEVDGGFAVAHCNLANCLKDKGDITGAQRHYTLAIECNAQLADPWANLGNLLKEQGQPQLAIQYYAWALHLNARHADASFNLAATYKESNCLEHAIYFYQHALCCRADFPDALSDLVHCLTLVCCWKPRDALLTTLTETVGRQLRLGHPPALQPHHGLVYPLAPPLLRRVTEAFGRTVAAAAAYLGAPRYTEPPPCWDPDSGERLRIGYVSSDFGDHPLSQLMQSVFELHDRRQVEVFGYALAHHANHPARLKIERGCDRFRDVTDVGSVRICELIRNEDRVHILVNLNGYTKGARNEIFAFQPAPIQVSYMGFAGTLGAAWVDYLLADYMVTPAWAEALYTEKVVRLPHSYFVNDHRQTYPPRWPPEELPTRAALGLPDGKFLFACFNQLYKITAEVWRAWMRILRRSPNAALWLLRFPPPGERQLRQLAEAAGVERDQLYFTDVAVKDVYMRRIPQADLVLDTPVYNGHTTVTDVLWAGVPVLTMPLEQMASRVAAGICATLGLEDFVVSSLEEYEDQAVYLSSAEGQPRLRAARQRLWEDRLSGPFFDTARWVRDAELLFLHMALRGWRGLPPAHLGYYELTGQAIPDKYVEIAARRAHWPTPLFTDDTSDQQAEFFCGSCMTQTYRTPDPPPCPTAGVTPADAEPALRAHRPRPGAGPAAPHCAPALHRGATQGSPRPTRLECQAGRRKHGDARGL
eukprot:EG_transcript_2224